jgi:hypothetical protein
MFDHKNKVINSGHRKMEIMKHKDVKWASTRILVFLSAGLLAWNFCGTLAAADATPGAESVVNGGMEKGNPPDAWIAGLGAEDKATLSADTDAHSGKQSLRISPLVNLGRAIQRVSVKPDTKYRYEFWYKSTTDLAGVYFFIMSQPWNEPDRAGYYANGLGGTTWTRWAGEFSTPGLKSLSADQTALFAFCGYLGEDVLIDDVSVTEVKPGEALAPVVNETPVAAAATAAIQDSAAAAAEKARKDWLLVFPGRKVICWDKSPWDNKLARVQLPPTVERPGYEFPFQECTEISVAMGENEYESASFVLTNLSDTTAEFAIAATDVGLPITIREAVWVRTFTGKEVNDALPLLEGNLSIPSGESREVWLTLYSRGVKPGDYSPQITVTPQGDMPASRVNLKVKIYPVSLPDDKPIYTFFWDMMDTGPKHDPERTRALIADKKAHYVTVSEVAHWTIPFQLNPDGTLKKDYQELDKLLEYYQAAQLTPKMFLISCSSLWWGGFPGKPYLSAAWKTLFAAHLTGLATHLKEKGYGYDRWVIHPVDEMLDENVVSIAKLIKEIDPKILVLVNSAAAAEMMTKIAPCVDIFQPHLYNFLGQTSEAKALAVKLLPKSPAFFWTYANPVPPFPQLVSPYSIYRLAVWQSWREGMGGHGNWIYDYKTHWNAYKHEDGENWAMVYFANAKDAPAGISKKELVVTGKRWEATREGIEDYVYLYLLKGATETPGRDVSPESLAQSRKVLAERVKTVLGDMKNTTLADRAKEDVLKALASISPEP